MIKTIGGTQMFVHKIDEDLSLKLIEYRDAQKIFNVLNHSRPYLKEWLPWLDHTTKLEDLLEYIKASLEGFAKHKTMNTVILFQNQMVGIAGYNEINWLNKTAYIGYWLSEEFQGKGIMTRVAKALTEYAINDLSLNKVEIRAAKSNMKSRGIPERLGYTNEGCIRQAEWLYDHYVDHVIYGVLAQEWNK